MKAQLEQRLRELRAEFAAGEKKIIELEANLAGLRNTLWRISGAIQVLEEELAKVEPAEEAPAPPAEEATLRPQTVAALASNA